VTTGLSTKTLITTAAISLCIWLCSAAVVYYGVYYGEQNVAAGGGVAEAQKVAAENLFRFDSLYYFAIADTGYSYNGDPYSSPNIVFAPLFPLLAKGLATIAPLDLVTSGLLLNGFLFFSALMILQLYLSEWLGQGKAAGVLLAMATSAGAYSFHAFYSESAMLFCLAVCLLSFQRANWWTLAFAAAALGATRLAAIPLAGFFGLVFLLQAWRRWNQPRVGAIKVLQAFICLSGAALYLGYAALTFGNPLTLFPEIQGASWGLFHRPIGFWQVASFTVLGEYWAMVSDRGFDPLDIKTLNLIWTSLAAFSVVYMILGYRRNLFTLVFALYFISVYVADASSEYLISAHRFFALMIPIFITFADLHSWIARKSAPGVAYAVSAALFCVNVYYGVIHAAYFNQGVWYYF
jgi:hypothetical protein